MDIHPLVQRSTDPSEAEQLQARRDRMDRAAHWLITIGGVGVMSTMFLMLAYLVWVALPLFQGAGAEIEALAERTAWADGTRHLAVNERGDLGVRIADDGALELFRLPGLESVQRQRLPLPEGRSISAVAGDLHDDQHLAVGLDDGQVLLLRYAIDRLPGVPGSVRQVAFEVGFPFGASPRFFSPDAIDHIAIAARDDRLLVAALAGRRLAVEFGAPRTDLLTGETTLDTRLADRLLSFEPTGLAVDANQRWVHVGDDQGRLHSFALPGLQPVGVLTLGDRPLTAVKSLLGGVSVLAGDAGGRIFQAFPVRDGDGRPTLRLIRTFEDLDGPVAALLPELRRRGFVAVTDQGQVGIFHSTAGHRVLERSLPGGPPAALALAPGAEQLLIVDGAGAVARLLIDNPHPEVTFAMLWKKVWYENYDEPRHVWQSTAANDDFEPKLSLTPLAVGTLKASLFAMAFAVPVALLGATYTAVFMAPALRRKVKPTIELMAAMPTVILGFLAGLWLAPFIEERLAGVFALALLVPPGLVAFAWAWTRHPALRRRRALRGWEPLLLVPVLIALSALALWLAPTLEQWLFGQGLREWLSQEAGVGYDQRNALVVGIAMGFSIIPIVFSIAEDALYAVPASLSNGAMALGATRWQTLVGIVLPTASPGIFSGLMIGLGRAVGETMIVLMATGNTPLMGWSAFEGMRTLAANIAIELPESSVAGTHYRVLFLSALVLFLFTFVVNTVAELVRQRLRERYASL